MVLCSCKACPKPDDSDDSCDLYEILEIHSRGQFPVDEEELASSHRKVFPHQWKSVTGLEPPKKFHCRILYTSVRSEDTKSDDWDDIAIEVEIILADIWVEKLRDMGYSQRELDEFYNLRTLGRS